MVNKKGISPLVVILGLVIVLGIVLVFIGSSYGSKFSCESSILEVGKIPMQQLSMVSSESGEICNVKAKFYVNNELICDEEKKINGRGYIPCKNLKEFIGENVIIKASFYDLDGEEIGTDEKGFLIE